MSDDANVLLDRALDYMQRKRWIRMTLAGLLAAATAAWGIYFLIGLLPKQYSVTMTGCSILSPNHHTVRLIEKHGANNRLDVKIRPVASNYEALSKVNSGDIDMAVVSGGYEMLFPNIQHVATLLPETMHILVKDNIKAVTDLKGKTINIGLGGTNETVAKKVLGFFGLSESIHYAPTHFSFEDMVGMTPDKRPDVVFVLSDVPSFIVEYFIQRMDYKLLEMPIPDALALRYGWATGGGKIPGYTYNINPPVPPADINAVQVNTLMVANSKVDPGTIFRVLEVLYSRELANDTEHDFDPATIVTKSVYPLSKGTNRYLHKDDPFLSMDTYYKLQNMFGMVMSFLTSVIVAFKWFKGSHQVPSNPAGTDAASEMKDLLSGVLKIEKELTALEGTEEIDKAKLDDMSKQLIRLRLRALEIHFGPDTKDDATIEKFLLHARHIRTQLTAAKEAAK